MILEGLVTTISGDGLVNLAPMGPIVDGDMSTLVLRPYQSSATLANLMERPEGVFHVTDDVLLLARAAIGGVEPMPEMFEAEEVAGRVVAGACRWYEFRIEEADTSSERTTLTARIVHVGRIRDYFGLHRVNLHLSIQKLCGNRQSSSRASFFVVARPSTRNRRAR